jgi:E3 ubiquitin-protein ligase NEDD4
MLESRLECVDECMERFELALVQFQWATSSREPLQPPKWHEPRLHAVWTVLIELELWLELVVVEVSLELSRKLRNTLAAHKATITALVVSVDRDWIINIRWISRHRDILAFEARRHWL